MTLTGGINRLRGQGWVSESTDVACVCQSCCDGFKSKPFLQLLIVVWHVLTKESADRFTNSTQVACSMFAFAHKVRVKNLQEGQTALGFTRKQLDRLRIGQEVRQIPWGTKTFTLPESKLTTR